MVRNRVWYALFLLACLVFSAAYQSRISAVLLVVAVAYPVLALILTVISVFAVKAGFETGRAVYEKNEQFEIPVFLKNDFIFPYAPAELDCMLPDNDTGLFMRKQIYVSVGPLKKMRIFVPCMHRYRGSYPAQICRVTVYDPLKLIRISRKLDARMQLVILPRKIPLERLGLVFGGDKGSVPEHVINGDREDFSHIREYVTGDILQQIHWKLTAKQQQLMIKQYESDGDRRCVILCNFYAGQSSSGKAEGMISPSALIRQSDAVIEAAVAVAMSAADAGIKAVADTGISRDMVCQISDRSSFDRFYDLMSVLPPDTETIDFSALVREYTAGSSAAMFLITPVVDEEILSAAELAARTASGAVVLIYVNCSGRSVELSVSEDKHFLFAEVRGEADTALPDAADKILSEYMQIR